MMSKYPDNTGGNWPERERYWRRRLGRIKLGVEPVEQQLELYRRITWMVTLLALGIGAIIFVLFAARGAILWGLAIAAPISVPVIALAWFEHYRLHNRAMAYLAERSRHESAEGNGKASNRA